MPASMIMKCQVAVGCRRIERWQLGHSQALPPEQPVHRPGRHQSQKLTLGVTPLVSQPAVDLDWTRCAQRDQHVLVHR
jgi:hypothetical protein